MASTTIGLSDTNFNLLVSKQITLNNITGNVNFNLPASSIIEHILITNNTANAVTGGINFGSTANGSDIVSAFACGNAFLGHIPDSAINNRIFSGLEKIYISAGSSWNSANVNIRIIYKTPA